MRVDGEEAFAHYRDFLTIAASLARGTFFVFVFSFPLNNLLIFNVNIYLLWTNSLFN